MTTTPSTATDLVRTLQSKIWAVFPSITRLVDQLPATIVARELGQQLVRSAAAMGLESRAVVRARTSAGRTAGLRTIAQDADEAACWLQMMVDADLVDVNTVRGLFGDIHRILAVAVTSTSLCVSRMDGADP